MSNRDHHIFSATPHLTQDELIRYYHHLLNDSERHAVEKHLVDCELCSDAMKGVAELEDASRLYGITRDLHKRARKKRLLRRKIFSQNEVIAILAVVFLILFLLIIAFVFFLR